MHHHNERTIIDSAVFTAKVFGDEEVKTISESRYSEDSKIEKKYFNNISTVTFIHYLTLSTIGILSWGLLWCAFGDGWRWDGQWFTLLAVACVAWASGRALEAGTTLPPLLAALLTGILARNLDILDMRQYTQIDAFLRKIYPVVILGKASLGWDLSYMKDNWQQISLLGAVPWCGEVVAVATCSHYLADFPWIWGFLLGSVYASVSCAVVMPTVQRVSKNVSPTGAHVNWSQLVCTAGGVDTALSVGVYGLIFCLMFYDTNDVYRYVKAGLTLFVGVGAGVAWGRLAGLVPHSHDHYHQELRILFVLTGGLFANFFTSLYGWGGTGGVAVLACNATAAMYWARHGWQLNNNPASTAYSVVWSALEPVLFAYTGTFFVIDSSMSDSILVGLEILVICLSVRLALAFLVCWQLTIKERLFVCCVWIPKSIVEAVLCPLALDTLLHDTNSADGELKHSEQLMRFIIQAILLTTPIGFLLTKCLGPILLRETIRDCSEDAAVKRSSQNESDGRSTSF